MTAPAPQQAETAGAAAYLRLVLFAGLVGIPAALVGAVFMAVIHELEDWLWHDLPDALGESSPPWYLVIGLPVVGALVVVAARTALPGDGGHSPLEGLGGGVTPLRHAPGIALAALGTLAFGAVLGPEAPLIALGSLAGVLVTHFVPMGVQQARVLATAGSFSAVSALFGGPLVAGVLLLESGVGLGAALIPALLPGLVAAAVGYLLFVGLGDWGGLDEAPLALPDLPLYDGTHVVDLLLAVVVGFLAAVLLQAVRRLARRLEGLGRGRLGTAGLLLAGGLAVGLLAQLADVLGGDSQVVLFSGQSAEPQLLAEESTQVVLVLLVAKALCFAVSLGCGFRGGPVFPAVVLGTSIAMLPVIWFDVSTTLAVAIGTAAGMAAMTRLLFSSLLFATLLMGGQGADAMPAAVLAAATAWITASVVSKRWPEEAGDAAAGAG